MNRDNIILHVDMDAFFAAIEQRDHPELRGKPVVVGSPPNRRGVVSTCSYEARRYGIHSAMPSRTAYGRCPHAVFMPVRGQHYRDVSRQIMKIFQQFTPVIEKVSIDEAFLDATSVVKRWRDAHELALALKQKILDETQLTCSVGIAPNKFLAKLASDMNKPDGLTITPFTNREIEKFLAPLPVERIWGVGATTANKLKNYGIHTIADLQACTVEQLVRLLGKRGGEHLHKLAFGVDDRKVETENEEKSVSHEETFARDVLDQTLLRQTLIELAERVGVRLRSLDKKCRTAFIKVRFADFTTITRQLSWELPTNSERSLVTSAMKLWKRENIEKPVRLLGFGVANLTAPKDVGAQPELFDLENQKTKDEQRLDRAIDSLRKQFGHGIITHAVTDVSLKRRRTECLTAIE